MFETEWQNMAGVGERQKGTNDNNTILMYGIFQRNQLKPLHPEQGRSA